MSDISDDILDEIRHKAGSGENDPPERDALAQLVAKSIVAYYDLLMEREMPPQLIYAMCLRANELLWARMLEPGEKK